MTPNTIDTLRGLGYTVGFANGSVETEELALANAQVDASPPAVTRQAGKITKATLDDLANLGKLPVTKAQKQALATDIAAAALEMVTAQANDKVDFHQRALEIAQASPDVFRIEHTVTTDDGDVLVATLMVAAKADGTGWDDESQATIDALADQTSFNERVFQAQNPEAMQAAADLQADGKDVSREPGQVTFTVDGKTLDPADVVKLADEAAA